MAPFLIPLLRSQLTSISRFKSRGLSFDYNNNKVRGVNLGGWFVLEPWITPSIFSEWANSQTVVDEYTYTKTLGKAEASSRLTNHWNTWITQADFNAIAAAGLNHVRIPIGYWAVAPLDGDPYVQGQLPILDQAIGWARSAGLKVLLDLHGAPGSQNGFDNSGRYGPIAWLQGDTVAQTVTAIQNLAQHYSGDSDVVTAIELLNEPAGWALNLDGIKNFYNSGYQTVRANAGDTVVCIHDAFQDFQSWNGFLSQPSGNVMLDTHQYQIFSPAENAMSPAAHVSTACALGPKLAGTDKWTIVGEWTGAQTDCAKWLNILGKGARYDGTFPGSSTVGSCNGKYTGTVAALSNDDKNNLRHFIEAQLDAYERHTGWIFWTWVTESAPEWHMKDLLANGLFPQPLTSRQYPGQCGY
jgi:glucan 1,3-beta-glucosidase